MKEHILLQYNVTKFNVIPRIKLSSDLLNLHNNKPPQTALQSRTQVDKHKGDQNVLKYIDISNHGLSNFFFLLPEDKYEVKSPGIFSEFSKPKYAVKGKTFVLECIGYGRYEDVLSS